MSVSDRPSYRYLRIALVFFGVLMLLVYPIAVVWPSGWIWHHGAPHESQYFMMIVGIYATLGVFLINAARDPAASGSVSPWACASWLCAPSPCADGAAWAWAPATA